MIKLASLPKKRNRKQTGSVSEAFRKRFGSASEAQNAVSLEESPQSSFRRRKKFATTVAGALRETQCRGARGLQSRAAEEKIWCASTILPSLRVNIEEYACFCRDRFGPSRPSVIIMSGGQADRPYRLTRLLATISPATLPKPTNVQFVDD
jgi:hypothetical protein